MAVEIRLFLLVYLMAVNVSGFAAMGIDKAKAKRRAWRIPEKTLFFLALAGGSAGAWAGMYVFHHKTKHLLFSAGIPAILFLQLLLAGYLLFRY